MALAASVTGCTQQQDPAEPTPPTLRIAGSRLPEAWIAGIRQGFGGTKRSVPTAYEAVAEGEALDGLLDGRYEVAAVDGPLSSAQLRQISDYCGGEPDVVPAYVSPVAVVFHVEGLDSLRLSPADLAAILSGAVKAWDDPVLKASNPDVDLPSTPLTLVSYDDAAPLATAAQVSVPPPTDAVTADDAVGMAVALASTDGAIGLLEWRVVGDLDVAEIVAGKTSVAPTDASTANQLARASFTIDRAVPSVAWAPANETAYPYLLVTYLVACPLDGTAGHSIGKARTLLRYAVSESGQLTGHEASGSLPLTPRLRTESLRALLGLT
ncbi:MAG TPA: substrate-binding domain-containing protein [Nocardioidaceae bacterium]|nr:substrate-binding domain-containing protein [Nocardioidaceae bacterium]